MTKPKTNEQLATMVFDGLRALRLEHMREALESHLARPDGELSRLEWFWTLLEPELRLRLERRTERRIREARFPARKTLAAFDFSFQPAIDKNLVLDLASLRFLDEGANLLLAGMSGTGKSHLAIALGMEACLANRVVRYTTSANLLANLNAALADGTLSAAITPFVRAQLLIIDEIGLEQVERKSASRSGLLQKVLFHRYEHRRSTAITSNIPWDAWGDYLDDHLGAAAILDRLIHRSRVIIINGPSYREHAHKKELEALVTAGRPREKTGEGDPSDR
jgi:DNA replication protein DnaC